MRKRLHWGILGTGSIAATFARGLAESETGELVAAGSRRKGSAERFGEEHSVPRRHASYDSLLADEAVEAVYVATPHPMHAEWSIKAAEAGKHILCEKPLTLNHAEAMAVVEAARANDVFLMEAFMYRCHPQTAKLVELIRERKIGEVRVIRATFSFNAGFDVKSRLFDHALGGGGILDVGCYCMSLARLVAGVAVGKDFEEPVEVKGTAHLGQSRVDEWAVAALRFPSGIAAELATGVRVNRENVVWVYGSEGRILVPWPWIPGREGQATKIVVHREGGAEPEGIVVEPPGWLYALEADTVARHIESRQAAPPAMTWEDSLGNMKALDAWRASIGLVYDSEKPAGQVVPVHKRPLSVRCDHGMKYGEVAGVSKPVARLVMGVDNQPNMPHAAVMFDDYFERGGNCFDTAYVYGGGRHETFLGHWISNRGVRDHVVIIGKGVHPPFNRPEHVRSQLAESLERMQTDFVDIYLAHRDNPEVPVSEWVDVFNELLRDGWIRSYGGSNWALERVETLNEYARSNALVGMAAVSNNFSLARMVDPVWSGCLAASDPESRAWLKSRKIPLFAWSSQARGFFTDRARPDDTSDAELVRCWYSKDNFQRQARVNELAGKRGVLPISIALAYVLHQPFPTFALIGPRTLAETRISMEALGVGLSPKELTWLNLETQASLGAKSLLG